MAVGTDHHVSRKDQALFRKEGVFDAGFSHLERVREPMRFRKILEGFALFCGKDVLRGDEVVRNEDDPVPIENFGRADLVKGDDGQGSRDIVSQSKIDPDVQKIAR